MLGLRRAPNVNTWIRKNNDIETKRNMNRKCDNMQLRNHTLFNSRWGLSGVPSRIAPPRIRFG